MITTAMNNSPTSPAIIFLLERSCIIYNFIANNLIQAWNQLAGFNNVPIKSQSSYRHLKNPEKIHAIPNVGMGMDP